MMYLKIDVSRPHPPRLFMWQYFIMAKRRATKNKFSANKRKLLVEEIQNGQHHLSIKALEALWKQKHFEEYPNRAKRNFRIMKKHY